VARNDVLSAREFSERAEKAEAELGAVPVDAIKSIAEREKYMCPPTKEAAALKEWIDRKKGK
jgi:hypothetical protein